MHRKYIRGWEEVLASLKRERKRKIKSIKNKKEGHDQIHSDQGNLIFKIVVQKTAKKRIEKRKNIAKRIGGKDQGLKIEIEAEIKVLKEKTNNEREKRLKR